MTNDELVHFMKKLTLKFEKGNTQSQTFYDNLPDHFLSKMQLLALKLKQINLKMYLN